MNQLETQHRETLPANHSASRSPLPESWIDRIFARLSAMYGSKFSAMWAGTDAHAVKAVWAERLAGFADMPVCIKEALDGCDDRPWPPTLPEFLQACRDAAKRHPAHKPLALSAPNLDPETVAHRLKTISGFCIGGWTMNCNQCWKPVRSPEEKIFGLCPACRCAIGEQHHAGTISE